MEAVAYDWPSNREGATSTAWILPGAGYTTQAPLLGWTAEGLAQAGWRVRSITWDGRAGDRQLAYVESALRILEADGAAPGLIIGKSLGAFALPYALRHDLPGVWLTPLTVHSAIRSALLAAGPDHLVIGGTADPMWEPATLAESAATLVSVEGASHNMVLGEGTWADSARMQLPVIDRVLQHAATVRASA